MGAKGWGPREWGQVSSAVKTPLRKEGACKKQKIREAFSSCGSDEAPKKKRWRVLKGCSPLGRDFKMDASNSRKCKTFDLGHEGVDQKLKDCS